MKKEKMKLGDLKVQSFATSMEEKEKQTIDGGAVLDYTYPICNGDSHVVCNSDMCWTAYGWWCSVIK